jgi:hypothetical protein
MAALRTLAPYAAIEFLLPGGSLIALALWFLRRRARKAAAPARAVRDAADRSSVGEFGVLDIA